MESTKFTDKERRQVNSAANGIEDAIMEVIKEALPDLNLVGGQVMYAIGLALSHSLLRAADEYVSDDMRVEWVGIVCELAIEIVRTMSKSGGPLHRRRNLGRLPHGPDDEDDGEGEDDDTTH